MLWYLLQTIPNYTDMFINSGNPTVNNQGPIDMEIDFSKIVCKLCIVDVLEGNKELLFELKF